MFNPHDFEEYHKSDKPSHIYYQPVGHGGSYINR